MKAFCLAVVLHQRWSQRLGGEDSIKRRGIARWVIGGRIAENPHRPCQRNARIIRSHKRKHFHREELFPTVADLIGNNPDFKPKKVVEKP